MPDFWKFPGTQREGAGIDSTIEDMALWDERERIATRLYVHAFGMLDEPLWRELNEEQRKPWRDMAYAEMRAARGVTLPHSEPISGEAPE